MQNFSHATEATETALNSAGSAAEENSRYMDSLSARVKQLQNSFQTLSNQIINSDLVGMILDIGNALLQFAQTPVGQAITQIVLLTTAIGGLSSLVSKFYIRPIITSIGSLISGLSGVAPAATAAGTAVTGLSKVLSMVNPVLAGIGIALGVFALIAPKMKAAYEEAHPTVEALKQDITEINDQLKTNEDRLNQLNSIPYNERSSDILAEAEALRRENEELRQNLEHKKQQMALTWVSEQEEDTESPYRRRPESTRYESFYTEYSNTGGVKKATEVLIESEKDYEKALSDLVEKVKEVRRISDETWNQLVEQTGSVEAALERLDAGLKVVPEDVLSLDDSLTLTVNELQRTEAAMQNMMDITADSKQQYVDNAHTLMSWAAEIDSMGISLDTLTDEQKKAYEEGERLIEVNKDGISNYAAMLDQLYAVRKEYILLEDGTTVVTSAMTGLQASLLQATSGGQLLEGQYDLLISKFPELSNLLTEQNGLWSLNREALIEAALAGNDWATNTINASNNATMIQINNVRKQISAITKLIEAEQKAAEAQSLGLWGNIAGTVKGMANQIKLASLIAQLYDLQNNIIDIPEKVDLGTPTTPTTTTDKTTTEKEEKKVDPIEEQNEKFEEQNKLLERQIELAEARGASEEELIALNQQYQNQLHQQAEWFRQHGVDESSEYIIDRSLEWLKLQQENADLLNESYDQQIEALEHQRDLLENQGADAKTLVAYNKQIQNLYHKQAEELRKMGYAEDSEEIRDAQKGWWDLENQNTELYRQALDDRLQISYDYIDDRNYYNDWGADSEIASWKRVLDWMEDWFEQGLIDAEYYYEKREEIMKKLYQAEQDEMEKLQEKQEEMQQAIIDSLEAQKEAMEETLDDLQDMADKYESAFNYVIDKAQDEIDALEEERDSIEKYWDDKIQALQDANDELEDQIELEEKLDALARARQTKVLVYKDGRYQYIQDADAVSEAQRDLEAYERDKQLQEEIERLEDLKEAELDELDERIEYWENFQEQWEAIVKDYEEEQDRLLAEEILGTQLEGENWEKRLGNVEDFKDKYAEIMDQISYIQEVALKKMEEAIEKMQQKMEQLQNMANMEIPSIEGGGYPSGGSTSGGSGGYPSNWKPGQGLTNWQGGTQTNDKGWVMDGQVAAEISGIGGGAVPVWYDPATGKVTSSGLRPGDIVHTQGGSFMITGGTAGNYTSVPYNPSSGGTVSSSGGGGSSSSRPSSGTSSITTSTGNIGKPSSGTSSTTTSTGNISGANASGGGIRDRNPNVKKYASGTYGTPGGLSLVGENGPELRVLGKGDGVLPSGITKNLWKWGELTPSQMMANIPAVNTSSDQITNITIQNFNPNLPNVKDGKGFIEYLKQDMFTQTMQFVNRSS